MSECYVCDLPDPVQSEDQAVLALLKKVEQLQKTFDISLRGSLAYYGILGFSGRRCHDIDFAAYDPAEAAKELGLSVDIRRNDCVEGHIGYLLAGNRKRLAVEILRFPRDIDTLTVIFPLDTENTTLPDVRIRCTSLEQILTEKLFSLAYALREAPANRNCVEKHLLDLSYLSGRLAENRLFSSQSIFYQDLRDYLSIERDREDRFSSVGQMLSALSLLTGETFGADLKRTADLLSDLLARLRIFAKPSGSLCETYKEPVI